MPYPQSPALAHTLAARRPAARLQHLPHYLLFGAALVAFLISAGAMIAPQVAPLLHRADVQESATHSAQPAPALSRADVDTVLSYARQMRADDTLVELRPGVFAKRSNVHGVDVGGRTIFYDVLPHQSFGPLRTGRVDESQVDVLARERTGDALVLVYVLK